MKKILFLLSILFVLWGCTSKDELPPTESITNGEYDCENILVKYNIPRNSIRIGSYEKATLLQILYLEDNFLNVLLFDPRGKLVVQEEHLLCRFKDKIDNEKINIGYGKFVNYHPNYLTINRTYIHNNVFAMAIAISNSQFEFYPLKYNLYFFDKNGIISKNSKLNLSSDKNTYLEKIKNGYILNHAPAEFESNSKYQYTLYNETGQLICISERQKPFNNNIELFTEKEVIAFELSEEKLSLYIYDTMNEDNDELFVFCKSDGINKFKIENESLNLDGRILTFKCKYVSYEGDVVNFEQKINLDTKLVK